MSDPRTALLAAGDDHADLTTLELEPRSLDAVAALRALNRVSRDLLAGLFVRIHGWRLRSGGLFLASISEPEGEATFRWVLERS